MAIYSRKSVYTGRGESVENQVEMCRAYVRDRMEGGKTAEIVVYEDEGFSGKNLERPRFQAMMEAVRGGELGAVICYRLDRISRSVSDFAPFVEELIGLGVAFVCIKEQFDTSTPMGKAMMYIASVFAQLERETIAERVRDNMVMLARTGRWLGGTAPLGFFSERVEEREDGRKRTYCRLVWDEAERPVVRRIFEEYLKGGSLSAVVRTLYRAGIRTRKGGAFTAVSVKALLQNPVYCAADGEARGYFVELGSEVCFDGRGGRGILSYNKRDYGKKNAPRQDPGAWILAEGQHEALLCGRDWVEVQRLLGRGRRGGAATRSTYALLSGMLRCPECGGRMFAKRRSGRESFDYICENKLRNLGLCHGPNLAGGDADGKVWTAVADRLAASAPEGMTGLSAALMDLDPTERRMLLRRMAVRLDYRGDELEIWLE